VSAHIVPVVDRVHGPVSTVGVPTHLLLTHA
jgi:hypothetical protein